MEPSNQQPQQLPTQTIQNTPSTSAEKIHLLVRNRTQLLFDDDVKSITSKNDTGIFDVLPEHANFISIISSPLIIGKLDGKKQEVKFDNGILKVKDNAVFCYIDLLSKKQLVHATVIPTGAQPIK